MKLHFDVPRDYMTVYTDPDKYYLIYTRGAPNIEAPNNYVALFKGNGDLSYYEEIYVKGFDFNSKFFVKDYHDNDLNDSEAYYDWDIIYELTDQEAEDHILIAGI